MQRIARRIPAVLQQRRTVLEQVLLGALALTGASHLCAQQELDAGAQRERNTAVAAARGGDTQTGLAALERLQAAYPESRALLYDRIAVSGWANADAQVLELGLPLGAANAPDFVQLAVAKAARNVRRFDVATEWYARAAAERPADTQARLGLLLTYGDTADAAGVRNTLATFGERERAATDVQLARGYALRRIDAPIEAVDAYERVLANDAANVEALRGKVFALRTLLLPSEALTLARRHPGILTDAEIARLEVDELAIRARLTARTPYPEPLATEMASRTIDALQAFDASRTDAAAQRALAFDEVVALADANRAHEAIAAFESIDGAEDVAASYVALAAANAYLQAQRPEDARRVIEKAITKDPSNLDLTFELVYAEMDLQRFRSAFAITDRVVDTLPTTNQQTGSAIVKGNGERMRAQLLAGLAEAYGDQLGAAQARFERLLEDGPNNAHARHELANVYRWRGWLDRSMFEYSQVLAVEPDLLGARAGYANTLFDARAYGAADDARRALARLYPTDLATQRLEERWRVHNLTELDVSASRGRSTGSTFGSSGYALDTRWFTRPTSYRFRGFVHLHDGRASFPEGDGRRRRAGGGVEYRLPRVVATGSVSANRSGGDLGLAGSMEWRIADTWSLGALVELDSDSVPLRGYRAGVEADQLGSSLRWAPNELGSVNLGWRELDLTDDNLQRNVFVDGRYRFLNLVNAKLDATGTVSAGTARRDDVPYFSPLRDSSWWAGLEWQQRLHRRYERSVVQTLGLRSGRYDQAGFDEGSVWQVQYEIDWRLSQTLTFGFGAQRAAQRYDGVREHTTTAFFNVNARL